jgi:hypothetical protein
MWKRWRSFSDRTWKLGNEGNAGMYSSPIFVNSNSGSLMGRAVLAPMCICSHYLNVIFDIF